MKLPTCFVRAALLFALGVVGCAVAQPKDAKPMLIDKFPADFWAPQTLLADEQYKDEQEPMVRKVLQLLQGKYRIIAKRIYLLPPPAKGPLPNPAIIQMGFKDVMYRFDAELIFANNTFDWPYINVWKTSGSHPEYVALVLYRDKDSNDENTFLGCFELQPVK